MIKEEKDNVLDFKEKMWLAVAIVAFVVIVLSIVIITFNVLLLVLAGALIALLPAKMESHT